MPDWLSLSVPLVSAGLRVVPPGKYTWEVSGALALSLCLCSPLELGGWSGSGVVDRRLPACTLPAPCPAPSHLIPPTHAAQASC